ncbi:MAG: hypothetical protein OXI83_15375 [Gemmatimonadota bacterium]|nr:hypothetical protein [Gemmatimonadota bacterium]
MTNQSTQLWPAAVQAAEDLHSRMAAIGDEVPQAAKGDADARSDCLAFLRWAQGQSDADHEGAVALIGDAIDALTEDLTDS